MDSARSTGVALALAQSVSLWTVILPPLTEIRRVTPGRSPDFAQDVRHAELIAATLTVSVGAVMSFMQKDSSPFVASVLMSGAMTAAYEYTLQSEGHQPSLSVIRTTTEQEA